MTDEKKAGRLILPAKSKNACSTEALAKRHEEAGMLGASKRECEAYPSVR
jgi:hypothetical protein